MLKQITHKVKKIKHWMNYAPPAALSAKGWRLFNQEFKEVAPFRYRLTRAVSEFIAPIRQVYNDARDWVCCRLYDRRHIVDSGLPPGYYGPDTLMMHLNFNMLKDFVEVALARVEYSCSGTYRTNASWCEKHMPFYMIFYKFRRPDLGIARLEWFSTLDNPNLPLYDRDDSLAEFGREVLALYKWWVDQVPARVLVDPPQYSDQGLGGLSILLPDFDKTAADYVAYKTASVQRSAQEAAWAAEDDEYLIRLVRIRKDMWV